MTDQNGSYPHRHADFQENNQQCHRQNNFRHDDRNIQHIVDEFLHLEFIPLQTEGTDGTDKYGNQSTQYRNDQTVDQTVHQCRIGKELGVPLCGKTIPVIIILLVIKRENHHNCHRNIQKGIHQKCIHITDDVQSFSFLGNFRHYTTSISSIFANLV